MLNISEILSFRASKFLLSSKICFSSSEKGEAIASAFIVSFKSCFSKDFQFIIYPFFSNNNFRSLKINSRSENLSVLLSGDKSFLKLSKLISNL